MVNPVEGQFYEAGTSRSVAARLSLFENESLEIKTFAGSSLFLKGSYTVEPPLGSLSRVVHFRTDAGDGRFESGDQAGFKALEAMLSTGRHWHLVAWLEGHWKGTAASLVLLGLMTFSFFQWVLPALAWKVATDMPQSWRRSMTQHSFELMEDMKYLEETRLEVDELERVQRVFSEALEQSGADTETYEYELKVRGSSRMGANAFAFPSGLVVATDDFVELCETDDQVRAVFLHEITHVERQHGIRALVQRGGVFIVFSILVGDASSAISLAEGIPALVMNSQYSQRFELESDRFAAVTLEAAGIGAEPMKAVLVLLHKGAPDASGVSFLSTHPDLRERIEAIERIEAGAGD